MAYELLSRYPARKMQATTNNGYLEVHEAHGGNENYEEDQVQVVWIANVPRADRE